MKEDQATRRGAVPVGKDTLSANRMLTEERMIRRDRMRFKKNKLSANLALLAILLDVLYFVNIYQNDAGSYYHRYIIGISIVYNLIFMLAAFLAEEGVKNYKKPYSIPLVILGIGQIVRIFILPLDAHTYIDAAAGFPEPPMGNGQFMYLVILLVLSAVCLIASAVVNWAKCNALEAHMKTLEGRPSGTQALAGKSA